jgi:hypothetical protein
MNLDKPVTAREVSWSLDMKSAPMGRKLLALNPGGVAVFASITPSTAHHYLAWCSLPKLTPEQKETIFQKQKDYTPRARA